MDPHCIEYGCYMFKPYTKERKACMKKCRLENGTASVPFCSKCGREVTSNSPSACERVGCPNKKGNYRG